MPNFFASFKFSLVIYDLLIHTVADEAVKIFLGHSLCLFDLIYCLGLIFCIWMISKSYTTFF